MSDILLPMKRLTLKKVFSGLTTPWRLAICERTNTKHKADAFTLGWDNSLSRRVADSSCRGGLLRRHTLPSAGVHLSARTSNFGPTAYQQA
eukprot:9471564-Pyramimonas_sp.AAC.1